MAEENLTANTQEAAEQQSNTPEMAEKTFTQAELDRIVTERIAREKAKLPTKEELAEYRKWRDENKTAEEKTTEEINAANAARTAAEVGKAEQPLKSYQTQLDSVSKSHTNAAETLGNFKSELADNAKTLAAVGGTVTASVTAVGTRAC